MLLPSLTLPSGFVPMPLSHRSWYYLSPTASCCLHRQHWRGSQRSSFYPQKTKPIAMAKAPELAALHPPPTPTSCLVSCCYGHPSCLYKVSQGGRRTSDKRELPSISTQDQQVLRPRWGNWLYVFSWLGKSPSNVYADRMCSVYPRIIPLYR